MKRAAMVAMMLGLATFVFGEPQASSPQKPATSQTGGAQPGASQSGAAQQSQGQQPGAAQPGAAPATPQGKRPPQAKTDAEFAAFNTAIANTNDPAAVEKAADDFAAKYPDSELRGLLYEAAMQSYQRANNADKMMEMGRKVLKLDPVVVLRLALALDKQGKYPEALKEANHAVQLTPEGTTAGGLARRERDRLVQLTGGTPTPASKPPASAQNPAPPKN